MSAEEWSYWEGREFLMNQSLWGGDGRSLPYIFPPFLIFVIHRERNLGNLIPGFYERERELGVRKHKKRVGGTQLLNLNSRFNNNNQIVFMKRHSLTAT